MCESEEERKGKGRQLKEKIRMINTEKEREGGQAGREGGKGKKGGSRR